MCRIKVRISGGEALGIRNQEYFWTGEPKDTLLQATNFAHGYAFALCEGKYHLDLQMPKVPQIDGHMWWMRGSNFKIEVLNMNNKPIKSEEDICDTTN